MAQATTTKNINVQQFSHEVNHVEMHTVGPDTGGQTTITVPSMSQLALDAAITAHIANPFFVETHTSPEPPGAPTPTSFLRGDGVWAEPSSNAVETWTTIKALSDVSHNSSNVVTDDGTLQVTLTSLTNYSIYLMAFFLTNATADLKYRLVFTGVAARVRRKISRTATSDTAMTSELKTAFDTSDVVLSTTGTNPWLEEDIIIQVTTGGVLKLQWGQVTSNVGPTTRLEGSYLMHTTT